MKAPTREDFDLIILNQQETHRNLHEALAKVDDQETKCEDAFEAIYRATRTNTLHAQLAEDFSKKNPKEPPPFEDDEDSPAESAKGLRVPLSDAHAAYQQARRRRKDLESRITASTRFLEYLGLKRSELEPPDHERESGPEPGPSPAP